MAENSAGVAYSYGANLYVRGMYENEMVAIQVCPLSRISLDSVKCLDGEELALYSKSLSCFVLVVPSGNILWFDSCIRNTKKNTRTTDHLICYKKEFC